MTPNITITVDFDNDEVRLDSGSGKPITCRVHYPHEVYDVITELLHMLNRPGTTLADQNQIRAEW